MPESRRQIDEFDWHALVHDIRAGLQSVDAAAQIGLQSTSEQVRQAALHDVAGAAAFLEWQLSDLLEGFDTGTTHESFELDLTAATALRALSSLAAQHRKRLLLDTSPRACALVSTDRTLLLRVLQNLVVNAIRYSESESIIVELRADEQNVEFSVRNGAGRLTGDDWGLVSTGAGRAANARRASRAHGFKGSGLGLAIANALATRLGGTCQVEARPERDGQVDFQAWAKLPLGSRPQSLAVLPAEHTAVLFDSRPVERAVLARQLRRLGWPVKTCPSEAARLEIIDSRGRCKAALELDDPRLGEPPTLRAIVTALLGSHRDGERLLLVDDNPLTLAGLMHLASSLGFASVRCARDAATALRLALAHPFDHAVIDLRLGTSSGRALAERLDDRVSHTVLVSADASGDVYPRPRSSAELAALLRGHSPASAATAGVATDGVELVPFRDIDDALGALIERLHTDAQEQLDLELHGLIGACRVWGIEPLAKQLRNAQVALHASPAQALEPLTAARARLAALSERQGSTADD